MIHILTKEFEFEIAEIEITLDRHSVISFVKLIMVHLRINTVHSRTKPRCNQEQFFLHKN